MLPTASLMVNHSTGALFAPAGPTLVRDTAVDPLAVKLALANYTWPVPFGTRDRSIFGSDPAEEI